MGGSKGRVTTRTNLWIQFMYHHLRYTLVIMEEGNHPHLHYPNCDMLLPWAELNHCHPEIALCEQGVERKRRWLG